MTTTNERTAADPTTGTERGRVHPSKLRLGAVIALVVVALLALPAYTSTFTVSTFSHVLIFGIAILSLDIVTGRAGQISLGHGGLMGMGAYTAALLIVHADVNPYLALLVAPIATALLGLLFAASALRLSGLYLALATFALALGVPQFVKFFHGFTGGTQGLVLPYVDSPVGALTRAQWMYYLVFAIAVLALLLSRRFLNGRAGRALYAVRDSELAATVCGVSLRYYKMLAFLLSSVLAGLAGGLLAIEMAFVSPDSFTFMLSLALFVALGIAGFSSWASPLLGGIILVYLPIVANNIWDGTPNTAYGALIVVLVLVGRGGISDFLSRLLHRNAEGGGEARTSDATAESEHRKH